VNAEYSFNAGPQCTCLGLKASNSTQREPCPYGFPAGAETNGGRGFARGTQTTTRMKRCF